MKLIILLILIVVAIILSKKKEHEKYNQALKDNIQFSIDCSKDSNRKLLNLYGDKVFIQIYGQEQYDKIKNNTDTELVKIINIS